MPRLIDIPWRPDTRALRRFGIALAVLLAAFAAWLSWRGSLFGWVPGQATQLGLVAALTATALASCGLALVAPRWLRLPFVGLSLLALPIGLIIGHLLLAIVYFLIMTPIGLVMRLRGRDPLQRRLDPEAETYWRRRVADEDPGRYYRQF